MKAESIVNLDPSKVLAEDNIRFGLLAHRVEAMADSIVARGGIQSPIEVEKLKTSENGYTHKLTAGFIRHAAALKLNTEQKAGLQIPAIVREPADALDRLMRQASENLDRENLSPMDVAVAMRKMLDAGVSKSDVRTLFKRPGGRKGTQMQPASNSFLNMHLAFLELPKSIQTKIHDGRIGTAAAYELTKVPADQRDAVLERAEQTRLKALDREEAAETKLAKSEEKEGEAAAKIAAAEKAVADAQATFEAAQAKRDVAQEAEKAARKTPPNYLDLPDADKKAIAEKIGVAKVETKTAVKELTAATNALSKATQAQRKVTGAEVSEPEAKAKATPTRVGKAGKTKGAAVGPKDVKQAAKEAGVEGAKPVALSASDCRAAAAELAKSRFPKVKAIGTILVKMLSGEIAPKTAETDLTVLTGERKTHKA